jgi:predicted enzyme related to lactoylglutathione lyase
MSEMNYDGGLTCAMNVSDLGKAIQWYQDVLGFTLLYRMDEMAWCELSSGVARVNVGLSQTEKGGGPGGATLTWGVKNIDEARRQLESKNVRFDGDTQVIEGMVKLATFYDIDGNAMMLYEDLAKK